MMDYFNFLISVAAYVENRLNGEFDYNQLERVTGFSLPHIRDVFKRNTNNTLAKYILHRKLSNAAFEIIHSSKTILDIANGYGFDSYDTFTRAFKRYTSMTPSEFRKNRCTVGRVILAAGIYGPGIQKQNNFIYHQPSNLEVGIMNNIKKSMDSCILYGVPKVEYSFEECTPFPSSLRACLNYMGQDISYAYLIAASGAAFRLRWNTHFWDGGNVDVMCIYDNPSDVFKHTLAAAGRKYTILERNTGASKDDFISFIKKEIDDGRPLIGLGIVGPPEACIITGYKDNGETLLGWNFFQHNPEFAKDITTDESGYFICDNWWENPNTKGLIAIGEELLEKTSIKDILINSIDVLSKTLVGEYAGGQEAFNAWANSMSDESQFPKNAVMPILLDRIMCQFDAITMISEGRAYAACFIEWVGTVFPKIQEKCLKVSIYFKEESKITNKMAEDLGGWQHGMEQMKNLANPSIRKEIVKLIYKAKELDLKALELLKDITNSFVEE